jgi:hypothetical protein
VHALTALRMEVNRDASLRDERDWQGRIRR